MQWMASWEQHTDLWALTIMPTLSLPLKKYSGETEWMNVTVLFQ